MSTLLELKKEFEAGKKLRRKDWDEIPDQEYIINLNNVVCNQDGKTYTLTTIELYADDWEVVPEDYTKYIGCLCWFGDIEDYLPIIGVLTKISYNKDGKFIKENSCCWKYCRPVKPEEVKFYQE